MNTYLLQLNHIKMGIIIGQLAWLFNQNPQYLLQMYKLYTFARSSTAWRARIALNLKGITPEYAYVHLFKGEQKNEQYQKLNPNMGVPTLILPNGTPLIETMAIIQYLNEVHPYPHNLFPGSPIRRAQIRAFCQVINSGTHPYQNLRLLEKLQKDFGADKKKWLDYWLTRGLDTIQKLITQNNKGSPYIFGDQVTAADIFFYPQIMATKNRFKVDISPYQNVTRILSNLQRIKQFQDSEPQKQLDFE